MVIREMRQFIVAGANIYGLAISGITSATMINTMPGFLCTRSMILLSSVRPSGSRMPQPEAFRVESVRGTRPETRCFDGVRNRLPEVGEWITDSEDVLLLHEPGR
jgi:hypothetical protein